MQIFGAPEHYLLCEFEFEKFSLRHLALHGDNGGIFSWDIMREHMFINYGTDISCDLFIIIYNIHPFIQQIIL